MKRSLLLLLLSLAVAGIVLAQTYPSSVFLMKVDTAATTWDSVSIGSSQVVKFFQLINDDTGVLLWRTADSNATNVNRLFGSTDSKGEIDGATIHGTKAVIKIWYRAVTGTVKCRIKWWY